MLNNFHYLFKLKEHSGINRLGVHQQASNASRYSKSPGKNPVLCLYLLQKESERAGPFASVRLLCGGAGSDTRHHRAGLARVREFNTLGKNS